MPSIIRSLLKSSGTFSIPARFMATVAETASTSSTTASTSESTSSPAEASSSSAPTPAVFSPFTRRCGLVARKRGMTTMWDQDGKQWPVTVLQVTECQVIQHRPPHQPPFPHKPQTLHGLQLGITDKRWEKAGALKAHFGSKGNGVTPSYRLKEFPVSEDAVLPVGAYLSAAHFVPGQFVDVRGKTIGKGFQGVMKRWGFRGQPGSHGTSLTHRSPGAIGANQDPGRVWPGKKMAGRMGGRNRTTQNLLVHRIDTALNLIYVRGAVPGPDDQYIEVTDAVRKVRESAARRFRQGKQAEEWLQQGVVTLPMPGVTLADVKKNQWPEVVEWPGEGKEPKVRG